MREKLIPFQSTASTAIPAAEVLPGKCQIPHLPKPDNDSQETLFNRYFVQFILPTKKSNFRTAYYSRGNCIESPWSRPSYSYLDASRLCRVCQQTRRRSVKRSSESILIGKPEPQQ